MSTEPNAKRGRYKKTADLVEDTEFLIETGCTWHEIPSRLKRSPEAAERALIRAGRADLVHNAKNLAWRSTHSRAS
jgi:hypothetical protein